MPGASVPQRRARPELLCGAFALMPGGGLGVQKSLYIYIYGYAYHIYVFMVQTSELTRPPSSISPAL